MSLLSLLFLLQSDEDPRDYWSRYTGSYEFGIGGDAAYWVPRFDGHFRVDTDSAAGTDIDLLRDLDLDRRRAIPIYGGGSFYLPITVSRTIRNEVLLTAEYWSQEWRGSSVLGAPVSLGDQTFPSGAAVRSRFRLDSLDLAIRGRFDDHTSLFRGGISLLLHGTMGRLEMSSATAEKEGTVGEIIWGFGIYGEVRPSPYAFAGISLKGYTSFGSAWDTNMADLQAYAGGEWGPLRLEAGFRYMPYSGDIPDDGGLRFNLYGPYAALSLVLKF